MRKSERRSQEQTKMVELNRTMLGTSPEKILAWAHPKGTKVIMTSRTQWYSFILYDDDEVYERHDQQTGYLRFTYG